MAELTFYGQAVGVRGRERDEADRQTVDCSMIKADKIPVV